RSPVARRRSPVARRPPPVASGRKPSAWAFMTVIFQLLAGPVFYPWRLGWRVIALSCRENRMPQ
ncbi:hypothetical protein, partial [Achromobacter spanius]|uniref:hypothetical protein n=1 Tax=Achromobacter spanius TaxID=217203 RepID=UPI003F690004